MFLRDKNKILIVIDRPRVLVVLLLHKLSDGSLVRMLHLHQQDPDVDRVPRDVLQNRQLRPLDIEAEEVNSRVVCKKASYSQMQLRAHMSIGLT